MKRDLKTELREALGGRTAVVGIGNINRGDDAAGVRLAERLVNAGCPNVFIAGTVPENMAGPLSRGEYDHVLFLDAVEMGENPGAVIFMNATDIRTQFPQISTHHLSLGMVAGLIESESHAHVHLLGIQPKSLRMEEGLCDPVCQTLDLLVGLLTEILGGNLSGAEAKCLCT